jgi:acetyl-CoA carboxylase carboxyl transferase subunit beta
MRLSAQGRIRATLDEGWSRIELPKAPADPLRFRDQRRYSERLKDAQAKTAMDDAVVVAQGAIEGRRVVVAAFEFSFLGGSMGAGVGEALVTAAKLAVLQDAPLIVFTASGGARMQEGTVSLMQMPRTVIATRLVKEAGLPFIVVLCDPTTGGVTASFAMLGDIQIAEPGALIGFAGARVIEQTVREKLPEGFQRAEYLLEHGILDMVVKRHEMRATLGRLISLLRERLPPPAPEPEPEMAALPAPEPAEATEAAKPA